MGRKYGLEPYGIGPYSAPLPIYATGAIIAPGASVSGSGTKTAIASAAIASPSATTLASGTKTVIATATVTASVATAAGAGVRAAIANAVITAPVVTTTGAGTRTAVGLGVVLNPQPEIAAQGVRTARGSGVVAARRAQILGAGRVLRVLRADGVINSYPAFCAGAGTRSVVGNAAVVTAPAVVSGRSKWLPLVKPVGVWEPVNA